MLSVRICPDLHARLKRAAHQRGVSITTVVEGLIEENLLEDVTAQLKFDSLQAMAHAQKGELQMLESVVLAATEPGNKKDSASLLIRLRDTIQRNRQARTRTQKEIKASREAHAQMRDSPPPRKRDASVFDGLGAADTAGVELSQLPLPERRRLRLRAALGRCPKGTRTRLAAALGVSPSFFSQMLSSPSSPGARPVNEKRARSLEVELGLPERALDAIEPQAAIVDIQRALLDLESVLREVKPHAARSPRKRRRPLREQSPPSLPY
ncbi:hypothetical protein [Caballeronia sp. RCC_10]|uniref:hypothetical protein n=1 Tax=Caballeronia sp. RCC_10 TaxID=3239227 RepID=UPI003525EA7F